MTDETRKRQKPHSEVEALTAQEQSVAELLCELCRQFYQLGWVSGTGGSISIRDELSGHIFMSPSAVQKERMAPDDIYVLDADGKVLRAGWNPLRELRLSQCHPLFMAAFSIRHAGAVIHTHSIHACLVTLLFEDEFRCTHLEMIKGVEGLGFKDKLVVPIIENTPHEKDLEQSLKDAIQKYPGTNAVLVRRHGVYVWGKDWIHAKTQCECLDYLFNVAIQMRKMNLDPEDPFAHAKDFGQQKEIHSVKAVVLDIEGTTSSISFVAQTLFPYAREHFPQFLSENLADSTVKSLCHEIMAMENVEFSQDSDILDLALRAIFAQMDADKKSTPLKALQGMIWKLGFEEGVLQGHVYPDTVEALKSWKRRGIQVFIYSSGSVSAQKLLFQYSISGDLCSYIDGHFDTTTGPKKEILSYRTISQTIGIRPESIVFATDNVDEASASTAAGWKTWIMVRPGNSDLPEKLPCKIAHSFFDLCI